MGWKDKLTAPFRDGDNYQPPAGRTATGMPWGNLLGIAALIFVAWFFFFRGDSSSTPDAAPAARTPAYYDQEYGGGTGRYQSILKITDCGDLQRMFNAGKANFDSNAAGVRQQWLGQMTAADDRLDALSC